ncbi:Oligopeptide transport ATP-binding protein OppD (TC 3.A.1.5.1) [hydrothermal vent metagenome]|uniref:Oligopeptide transport ATP-binding protein OppD (TC 3.A.1.5.1) n=1 Tax=hydrothermal vent metagenome TaxID=652676 RepID=A0A3B0TK18_9ZZZZ
MALLDISNLCVAFETSTGLIRVLDEVSYSVGRGQAVGLVGESGCGKSMTALAIMGLLPKAARISGAIHFDGQDLLALDDTAMSDLRGRRLAMVFQEPMTALNPVRTIGHQIAEGLRWHFGLRTREARRRTAELLTRVGLPAGRSGMGVYPHELSGGQRQRVVIAMALASGPDILIADEPTTALDVTTQAQILDLLVEIAATENMALVLITHDLGVIAQMTDRMAVMYAGRIVEDGPTALVFSQMAHPYTRGLFAALPTADLVSAGPGGGGRLKAIPGEVPSLGEVLRFGCAFAPRCAGADARCRSSQPPRIVVGPDHGAACLRPQKGA